MSTQLTISGKVMGKSRPTFTDWELTLPETLETAKLSLRSLLTHIVFAEVSAFEARQSEQRLLRILSPEQIQLGVEQGKVDLGGSELDRKVEAQAAVEVALQAFEDGLYFVFVDDNQIEDLNTTVVLKPASQLLFLRLVPLVGG
jgi:hypothetical protein